MLDIDHFKKINDTYGHEAGDLTLMALCTALQNSVRQSDIVGRLGGEEFAVILEDADKGASVNVAEKLRG
jgi:diguanylate cyclase (GGDEF)-like protein